MARYVECDICETKQDPNTEVMELLIPAQWITERDDDPLHADVCSWKCLRTVIEKFDPTAVMPVKRELDEGPKNTLPGVRIKTAGFRDPDDY